ncbi:MAG: PEP-CTERM sorting domain-containing protein [Pyrinomonadaceae bacterium]|nr:PEP-CTERM sorting domain-containing protein [Pyrinomonadaceae bacterium]
MPLRSKFVLSLAAFAVLSLGSAMSARADIIIVSGNVPQTDENVLFMAPATGNPVFGVTNMTNFSVRFLGTETLNAETAMGQARVMAADGSLNNLTIDLASTAGSPANATFTSLILNPDASANGMITFTVTEDNGMITMGTFSLTGTGSNFFTITAINGQRILSVNFTTTVALDDASQFRIGGAQSITTVIPEPTTMLLLGTGLAGIAAKVRRRRKA